MLAFGVRYFDGSCCIYSCFDFVVYVTQPIKFAHSSSQNQEPFSTLHSCIHGDALAWFCVNQPTNLVPCCSRFNSFRVVHKPKSNLSMWPFFPHSKSMRHAHMQTSNYAFLRHQTSSKHKRTMGVSIHVGQRILRHALQAELTIPVVSTPPTYISIWTRVVWLIWVPFARNRNQQRFDLIV